MHDEFWQLLQNQPGVGVLIIDIDGSVVFCNEQSRQIYYGGQFDPVGKTIEEIEGPEFASERMPLIREVIRTGVPIQIRHIRGGRNTESMIWPMREVEGQKRRIIAITRQGIDDVEPGVAYRVIESRLVDLGPLDVLTRRELEVMALIGHGIPFKTIASMLGVTLRTIERYRTDIARKLHVATLAEIACLVQAAGLESTDASLTRIRRWQGNTD
ncbi:MAG: LuxR C-terminal-related transcriptional regulator [Planctomycetaceae bacterium]